LRTITKQPSGGKKEKEQMEKINWPKVWMEIGEAFETPLENRDKRMKELTYSSDRAGICFGLRELVGHRGYDYLHRIYREYGYWWPRNNKGDLLRATFCYFMAAMGQKGFEDFLSWCKEN
jgi:hypothetical protein